MMFQNESVSISAEAHLVMVRHRIRSYATEAKLGLVDVTKLVTAASELARNMLVYAGGGRVSIEHADAADRLGIRVTFEDLGPGIADIDLAMTDGYSTEHTLGLGLPGARRLVDSFEITSQLGKGTRVVIVKWKR